MNNGIPYSQILGVRVAHLTVPMLHESIARYIQQQQKALVLNVNVHCLNLAYQHAWLRHFLNSADLVFCDGAGVILGGRILGEHIPQRITYADWMWQLAAFAERWGFTFFFLGSRPTVAERAARRLIQRSPQLRIVGTHHGHFDQTPGSIVNEAVLAMINAAHPDILVLGMGMPLQERWLMNNWASLQVRVALTGGAVFDYVSGDLRRGPQWMTNHGLEWAARLLIEPQRLWRRYLVGNPLFLWRVLQQRIGVLRLAEE